MWGQKTSTDTIVCMHSAPWTLCPEASSSLANRNNQSLWFLIHAVIMFNAADPQCATDQVISPQGLTSQIYYPFSSSWSVWHQNGPVIKREWRVSTACFVVGEQGQSNRSLKRGGGVRAWGGRQLTALVAPWFLCLRQRGVWKGRGAEAI